MNRIVSTIAAAVFVVVTGNAFAGDDIGPDQAVKLLQEGKIKSFEELNGVAQAKHPGAAITETELEDEHGRYVYKVELRDSQGVKWDVELDAANGEILGDRQDD